MSSYLEIEDALQVIVRYGFRSRAFVHAVTSRSGVLSCTNA